MSTSTLMLGIALNTAPTEVFHAFTDSVAHSRFTGGESAIEPREGGSVLLFRGRRVRCLWRSLASANCPEAPRFQLARGPYRDR
jgi:hypothetical protein